MDRRGAVGPHQTQIGLSLTLATVSLIILAIIPVEAPAQTLNMSHDLVTLGIASQNLTPNNPALDARPLFQAALQYVKGHPIQTVTLDKGSYYLLTAQMSSATLVVPQLGNVTIDLAGSTIYFNGPLLPNGIELYYCSNVTLQNFQIDYVNPPYTHVQLTSVDTTNRLLKYQTLAGWPDPASFNTLTSPFGGPIDGFWAAIFRNGNIVPGTSRTLLKSPFTNGTLPIQDTSTWAQSATLSTLRAGDTVVVAARGGGPPIFVFESDSITLSNISIYGSPTWAFSLFQTSNSTVDSVKVMPRPGLGLIGSNADGIHFPTVGPNNHIRNSYVARTMDDALILESANAAVVNSQSGLRQLTVTRKNSVRFPNGTAMNFVDPSTTLESSGANIVAQSPADSPQVASSGQVTLTFDRDLPTIAPGTIMAFGAPAMRGLGSTIEDNVVEDTYGGRGVWLPGVQGVTIQRNVFRRTSLAGIILAQETDAADDPKDVGPPAHDITITSNSLEAVQGPAAPGSGIQNALGAIEVVSTNNQAFGFASTPANTNVTIANNYIADSGRSGIWVGEVSGGTVKNNLVIRSSQNPALGGSAGIPAQFQNQVAQDAQTPVVIRYSSGTTEASDTIAATSSVTAPVTMTPANTNLAAGGGNGSFQVATAVSGFDWRAATTTNWISIAPPASGPGAGVVSYSVPPNSKATSRTGAIVVAGETFTVTQAAGPAFSYQDLGANSFTTKGSANTATTGYGRIQPTAGSTTPSGFAIFGYRQNGVLVSEAAVPASPLLQNGRIYAEIGASGAAGRGADTGLAIANPNSQAATISFTFTTADGTDTAGGAYSLAAGGQLARFLEQAPWNGALGFQGAFSFTSNIPVSVIALQGFRNERGDFLMTTLPVIDTSVTPGTSAAILPQYADGGGYTTAILLLNPTDATIAGTVQFFGPDGTPQSLTANGQTGSSFNYSVPRRSSLKFVTAGVGNLQTGTVMVAPNSGNNAPVSLAVFSYAPNGITVSQTGVSSNLGTAFRIYVEASTGLGSVGSYSTGFAVGNASPSAATVTLELFTASGSSTGMTQTLPIAGLGQVVKFLAEVFPGVTLPFQGLLRVTTSATAISVVALRLRYNERGDFLMTTTPPANEASPPSMAELDFPQIVDGGGYATQFILFSGTAGQSTSGSLRFFDTNGVPLNLPSFTVTSQTPAVN